MSRLIIRPKRPPAKLAFLFTEVRLQYRYFILEGGRGGGKTETLGQFFVLNSFNDSGDILCLREIQNSIQDSVYKVIVEWINILGVAEHFSILKTEIVNLQTGAKFIFRGMKGASESSSIKSLKGIKYVWYEEAQTCSQESIDMLLPTIREPNSQFFFSMNPDSEKDVVPNTVGKMAGAITVHINYYENQYCPQELIDLAEQCKELWPQDYEHIWLGKPRGDGDRQSVVTKAMLAECIDAHKDLGHDNGFAYGGLDMASGETRKNDKNALTIVRGPVVLSSEEWRSNDMAGIADKVFNIGTQHGISRVYFDAVGVGGFAEKQLMATNPSFAIEPYMGQNSPRGGEKPFIRSRGNKVLNKNFFKNLKSQQWWNLRLRAENTMRLKRGFQTYRPEYYLSLDSGIENLHGLIDELSQATWIEDNSGRIMIDKTPADYRVLIDGKKVMMRSPNRADSLIGAYTRSCKLGLKANR